MNLPATIPARPPAGRFPLAGYTRHPDGLYRKLFKPGSSRDACHYIVRLADGRFLRTETIASVERREADRREAAQP